MRSRGATRTSVVIAAIVVVVLGVIGLQYYRRGAADTLVVYCAHDSVYADAVLKRFEAVTGIPVEVKYDTEATKSLGLIERIIAEKDTPVCDVFWNNELLGTMDLCEKGLLEPYKGAGYQRIPDAFKDPDGRWAGFGARVRVFIVNTEKMPATEEAVAAAVKGDLSRCAVAKPLYGTTLTHYSVLWDELGAEGLKAWHADILKRGIHVTQGNAANMRQVAEGSCDFAFTDTDDFFVAKDDGKPVGMVPVRLANAKTIAIPNTVCIIRGTDQPEAARLLVDFLLSEDSEVMLAASKSRQVPLGPVKEGALSEDVRQLKVWADEGYPLSGLGKAREECLTWLKEEYLK